MHSPRRSPTIGTGEKEIPMSRKTIDCRTVPNDVGCTLSMSGEPGELVTAAAQHAVAVHGHADAPELREQLSSVLADEPAASEPGAFVQLIEFDTDRVTEWDAIVDRWATAIGPHRTSGGLSSAPIATGPAATSPWWSSPATRRRWPTPGIRPPRRS
jgi:Protein of unknown function (DUF1059)